MEDDAMREVEKTVLITLLIIGWISEEPDKLIGAAHGKLSARTDMLRRKLGDLSIDPDRLMNDFVDTEPVGIPADVILDDAIRDIKLRRAHHGKVHSVLPRCIMYRRIRPGVRRRRWMGHHFTADVCAEKALTSLRKAVSFSRAVHEALAIAGMFAKGTPPWVSWMRMAEQFWSSATGEAYDAWRQVVKMRHYIRMEFYEVWLILND